MFWEAVRFMTRSSLSGQYNMIIDCQYIKLCTKSMIYLFI